MSDVNDGSISAPPGGGVESRSPGAAVRLRSLPAVDALLQQDELQDLIDNVGRPRVAHWARQAVESLRTSLLKPDAAADRDVLVAEALRSIAARHAELQLHRLRRVINATGVLLHTNIGRSPLADAAIDAVNEATRFTNLELDLTSGRRGRRGAAIEQLLCELTGAGAALLVNNCAAATLLVLQTLAGGREVLISRGQLIEIGGSYRLPDVFTASGAILREVGTTNRTRLSDYEHAISADSAALLRVHHSNYRIVGFTEDVPIGPLAELAHARGLTAIDDLGSGCLHDLSQYGLGDEPVVSESLNSGADLVLFSGDKLLGGPQCGVILGAVELIDRLRASPLARALRVDKLTLAALGATLELHLSGEAFGQVPVLRMISADADGLRRRAVALCETVKSSPSTANCEPLAVESTVGGGSLPGHTLASWAVRLETNAPDEVALRLRTDRPAVLARIEGGAVILDLRSVLPEEDELLAQRLAAL